MQNKQKSLQTRPNQKLSARFYGPYEVIARVGKVAYKLQLPPSTRIHPVFHVSQLRQALGPHLSSGDIPLQLSEEGELMVKPEALLNCRTKPGGELVVLIRWQGLPVYEASWETYSSINHNFLEFHLEDKVHVWQAGNDAKGVRFTCSRKNRGGNEG